MRATPGPRPGWAPRPAGATCPKTIRFPRGRTRRGRPRASRPPRRRIRERRPPPTSRHAERPVSVSSAYRFQDNEYPADTEGRAGRKFHAAARPRRLGRGCGADRGARRPRGGRSRRGFGLGGLQHQKGGPSTRGSGRAAHRKPFPGRKGIEAAGSGNGPRVTFSSSSARPRKLSAVSLDQGARFLRSRACGRPRRFSRSCVSDRCGAGRGGSGAAVAGTSRCRGAAPVIPPIGFQTVADCFRNVTNRAQRSGPSGNTAKRSASSPPKIRRFIREGGLFRRVAASGPTLARRVRRASTTPFFHRTGTVPMSGGSAGGERPFPLRARSRVATSEEPGRHAETEPPVIFRRHTFFHGDAAVKRNASASPHPRGSGGNHSPRRVQGGALPAGGSAA